MAPRQPTLTVVRSAAVIDELDRIWRWNAHRYSPTHADAYLCFLTNRINELATKYTLGRLVPNRLDLRYVVIRRKSHGHGHVAVYRFDPSRVEVLFLFHTAQDWERTLSVE